MSVFGDKHNNSWEIHSRLFREPEGVLSSLLESITGPYPEPVESYKQFI
jgi:hypothetical protein